MRKGFLLVTAATFIASTAPAFAQTGDAQMQKDECLVASQNCLNQVDDIYKRMHRLDREIRKGKKVYTKEELNRLQQKLAEAQEMLKDLERPGK